MSRSRQMINKQNILDHLRDMANIYEVQEKRAAATSDLRAVADMKERRIALLEIEVWLMQQN